MSSEFRLRFDSVNRTLEEHTQTLGGHGDALAEILWRLPEPD